jgi:hypothetical protein
MIILTGKFKIIFESKEFRKLGRIRKIRKKIKQKSHGIAVTARWLGKMRRKFKFN